MPVVDIADMLGYSRSAINKAIKDHEGKINPCKTFLPLSTPGGFQQFVCLNREGVDYLLLFIHPAKTRMSDDEYIDFRHNLLERMSNGKPEIPKILPVDNPLAAALTRHADIADILIARYGYKPEIARNLAMQAVVTEQGEKAIIYRGPALLPAAEPEAVLVELTGADPDFDKYFSLTKVAEFCKCTTDQARNILEKEKVLDNSNGLWHLTRYGESFGKVFTINPLHPHRLTEKKMIRYNPDAVELVKKHMAAGQSELPLKSDATQPR
jgi:hypothetical protein